MTWANLHDFVLMTAAFAVVFWFTTGYPPEPPLVLRLKLTIGAVACVAAVCLLVFLIEASVPTLCLTTACNKTAEKTPPVVVAEKTPPVVFEKAPPVVPKPVRTLSITVIKDCPEGYALVTRHDNGQTACANNFAATAK